MAYKKCTIVSLDDPNGKVEACFNPGRIKISKTVPWNRHPPPGSDAAMLEFTSAKNRVLTMELFFDGYEREPPDNNVEALYVDKLMAFTQATVPIFRDRPMGAKRPPFVMVVWGKLSRLKGVIESVDTDMTMFEHDGVPTRATCSIKITEVDPLQFLEKMAEAIRRRPQK